MVEPGQAMPMRRAIFISGGKSKGIIASCTTAGKDAALHNASFEVLINEKMGYPDVVSRNPTHHNCLSAPGRNCKTVQILPESGTASSLSVPRFY